MRRTIAIAVAAAGLAGVTLVAGCAGGRRLIDQEETPRDINWRRVATPADRTRLREWRQAWVAALAMADRGGGGALLAADSKLFDPDRALPDAPLAAGRYRCRVVKLGGRDAAAKPVMVRGWTDCRVADERGRAALSIAGDQRLHGYLFDGTDSRQMFLGTLALGDETRPMRYGRDARRDAAGFVERIGPARWRLVLPYPGFESTLDVVEIAPAG